MSISRDASASNNLGKAQPRCWTHQSFCTDEKTWFSRIVQITWFVDLCRNVGLQMAAEGVELASLSLVFSTHEMQEIICQRFYLYEIIQPIRNSQSSNNKNWRNLQQILSSLAPVVTGGCWTHKFWASMQIIMKRCLRYLDFCDKLL